MVFRAITSFDDVMPPFISPPELRLKMDVHIKCLEVVAVI